MAIHIAGDPLKNAIMAYVERLIDKEIPLTPLPWVASRLSDLLANEESPDPRRIASVIKNDIVLSAETLCAVNQEAEKFGSRICSIDSAVSHLGTEWFAAMAKTLEVERQSDGGDTQNDSELLALHKLVWRHSLMRAEIAQSLAEDYAQWPDQAYTCALLSQLGTIAALRCLEQILANNASSPFSPNKCLELAQSYNNDILAMLAEPLHLPNALIAEHTNAQAIDCQEMRTLLKVAESLAGTIDCSPCFNLESVNEILAGKRHSLREEVLGIALGIAANIQYQDDQAPACRLSTQSTAQARKGDAHKTDVDVTFDDSECEYRGVQACGLSLNVRGQIAVRVGDVLRIEVRKDYDRYRFTVLCQGCEDDRDGEFIVDLIHLPVHEEALARWREVLDGDLLTPTASHLDKQTRDSLGLLEGEVSDAFAALVHTEAPLPAEQFPAEDTRPD